MKKTWLKMAAFVLAAALVTPATLKAQDDKEKEKVSREKTDVKERKDVQQIIVTHKGGNEEKMVIEINGDNVIVNGKPLEEYKKEHSDINVRVNKLKDMEYITRVPNVSGNWNQNSDQLMRMFREESNRAMLGVTTDKTEKGAEISSVTKESAAAKLGLKEGDVITKVDDKKIETPDDLSTAIRAHKPGEKVAITYLRDNKEQKGTAELGSWKAENFKMDMGDVNWEQVMPKIQSIPRVSPYGQVFTYNGNTPKLGLSVQDTDDGKGVKVINVDEESNAAKAGIKKDDIITEVDGKAINSTDEMVKSMKENKDKISSMFKINRAGKTQNVEVKMPRLLKTKDL